MGLIFFLLGLASCSMVGGKRRPRITREEYSRQIRQVERDIVAELDKLKDSPALQKLFS